MDRENAAQALQMLRKVVAQARDDTALENWGLIWVLSSFSNTAGFFATQRFFSSGERRPWPYALLWVCVLGANAVWMALLRRKNARVRTFIERQIWSLWTALVVAMGLMAIVNYLMGLDRLFMPAAAGLLIASTFAAMGGMMSAVWYWASAGWALFALAMAVFPHWQFGLLGVAWFCSQFPAGVLLHRAKVRRAATAGVTV